MKLRASEEISDAQRAYIAFLRARMDYWWAQPLAGDYCFEIAQREAREAHPLTEAERVAAERYVATSLGARGTDTAATQVSEKSGRGARHAT